LSHILRDRVAPVEMELAAYEQGNYELLVSLILQDPWTRTEEQARNLVDRILSLPGLESMKQHYKR